MELWAHHNAKALISLDIRTMDEAPLCAAEVNLHLPTLQLAHVKGSPQIVERNEKYIRQNPMDVIAVFFALEGEAFFYYQGGLEALRPGQAVMYDVDRPFMRGFSSGVREMVLTIPREAYRELSGGRDLLRPKVFDFDRQGAADLHMHALAKLVSGTLQDPAADPQPAEHRALELLGLLASGCRSGTGEGYLAAAKACIEDRLGDPALCPAVVAAAVGVSERHLARIFAAENGEPPSQYILGRRLELARSILADPHKSMTPVGTIAGRTGFASQSYFSRAFKARFGVTPLQARRSAGTPPS
ncbi:AraC family transcriptional regulator [Arthrobacter mangrovi]|uniref:AraC family transcriptional regulator n=2 Tax=Arthrobacter mangrovi TaxID=2966350 RepID=A0ABQ5MPB7_9MICC|nr:AraC family transcriptional regulator [Arthrobacter mangrovi]